jgi:AcrR family transcriptional regulator
LRADARRNRAALLTTAREMFLASDAGTGVEEIAQRAGVSVGTLYRHFDTREALVQAVYRQEVDDLCAAPAKLLTQHAPEEALRRFLLLLVEHAAFGKGLAEALGGIMMTDSPVFDDARTRMAQSLDHLLAAGAAAATLRGDITGRTLLRAMGGICEMRAATGWQQEAEQIATILYDGLRHGRTNSH